MPDNDAQLKEESATNACDCFCMGLGPQVTRAMRLGSEQAREHFRTARLEMLRGLRALIDDRIEKLSKTPEKGTKVDVE